MSEESIEEIETRIRENSKNLYAHIHKMRCDEMQAVIDSLNSELQSYKRKLIAACEEWCNDRRTDIVYGGLDKDALRLLEFIKTWEPGEK